MFQFAIKKANRFALCKERIE